MKRTRIHSRISFDAESDYDESVLLEVVDFLKKKGMAWKRGNQE